ncbi:tripartite tricarboxylate transporter substrate binding protein [Ideonella sp. 4Y11]|uniref:Tripartite tricarboxylate transporter substrate binding protein n=1 Tax=Ideonella aquatica TaxID=2824119 RepID=A0A940YNR3_9BURK|nr:tripartite tricarboxylate transporter substrate binding protein [Ideonella aquatica]MBQ0961967.1 tripartite tricarboxylate transporter substrate binding protein [Ideonella aquatica]
MLHRRQILQALLGATAGPAVLGAHAADAFPAKLMTMIVPYPAGGPSDFIARQIQPELSRLLGQQMIVENIGGVGGALGIQKAIAAPPDGHTLTMASPMELVLAPLGLSAVKFKPEDMRLVALLVTTTMVMLARKDLPASSVDELVAMEKKPGAKELSFGSVGPGSLYHLVAEKFSQQTGLKMLHVPYKGAAPLITDLMGGQIDIVFMPLSGPVPGLIKEGKVKAFGVASKAPHPLFPNLPTLTSTQALEGFEFDLWAGLQVPRGVPDAAVEALNKAALQALQNPDIRKAYEGTGNVVGKPMNPAELQRFYTAEIARYTAIATSVNLQPQ